MRPLYNDDLEWNEWEQYYVCPYKAVAPSYRHSFGYWDDITDQLPCEPIDMPIRFEDKEFWDSYNYKDYTISKPRVIPEKDKEQIEELRALSDFNKHIQRQRVKEKMIEQYGENSIFTLS